MKKNISFMLIAFFVAILIWFQVNLLREQDIVIDLPVRIINIPEDLSLSQSDATTIPIRVRSSGFQILWFYFSGQTINYNGSDAVQGENTLDMARVVLSLSSYNNLHFTLLNTSQPITFYVDKIEYRQVPVIFDFYSDGDKEILTENNIIFDEYLVLLSGPSLKIQNIESVHTEQIRSTYLQQSNKSIRILPVGDDIIIVPDFLELKQIPDVVSTRTISSIPINFNHNVISIHPTRVAVRIEGKLDVINAITINDIHAFIDQSDHDNKQATIQFVPIPNTKIIDFTPHQVSIRKL